VRVKKAFSWFGSEIHKDAELDIVHGKNVRVFWILSFSVNFLFCGSMCWLAVEVLFDESCNGSDGG
jgi:hypothetical protein